MKKLIVMVLLVVVLALSCLSFAGCEDKTITLYVDYQITDQLSHGVGLDIGSLLIKPSDPYYTDKVFYSGRGAFSGLNTTDEGIHITNARINDGYDAESNYIFMGWYKEPECIRPWIFSEDRVYIHKSTIYAKWLKVS